MSRTVLITGANRGIGLSLTQQFHDKGDKVIAVCRGASQSLKEIGVEIIEGVDVSTEKGMAELSDKVGDRRVDILVNNAGILRSTSLDNLDFEQILLQFEVNAMGPLRVVDALRANLDSGSKVAMITSRMGSIEDNTSGGGYGYRMSKTALNAAGKSLAVDLKPSGIAVALLHPGWVNTEMVNFNGQIEPQDSARGLIERIEALDLENSGGFWHANGELLPW